MIFEDLLGLFLVNLYSVTLTLDFLLTRNMLVNKLLQNYTNKIVLRLVLGSEDYTVNTSLSYSSNNAF